MYKSWHVHIIDVQLPEEEIQALIHTQVLNINLFITLKY